MDQQRPSESRATLVLAGVCATAVIALAVLLLLQPRQQPAPPPTWEALAPPPEVRLHPWRWIVIHHSDTAGGSVDSIDRVHRRERGWDGIGYHAVVGNGDPLPLGYVEATSRWRTQSPGAHAGSATAQAPYNRDGIGVCLIGAFAAAPPDELQLQRTAELCAILIRQHPTLAIERIIGHRDVPGKRTECPGQISIERLRLLTRQAMERQGWPVR